MPWVSSGAVPPYIDTVKRCLSDEKMFSVFKHLSAFNNVVGISEHEHALYCYRNVLKHPEVWRNVEAFKRSDTIGHPFTTNLSDGKYGRDTLRFAESVCFMLDAFKDLNGKRIVEFGSNYGGLAFCMLTQWPEIKAYHMIDLPEVQQLSRKYLTALGCNHPAINFDEPTEPADLFVSEYALTEFDHEDLYAFTRKYLLPANAFHLRCNIPEPIREKDFIEFLRRDFNLEITREIPVRGCNKLILGYK